MTRVLFIGGVANGEILEFPEFTLLSDIYPLASSSGDSIQVYELHFDPNREPQHSYRLMTGE